MRENETDVPFQSGRINGNELTDAQRYDKIYADYEDAPMYFR